MLGAEKLILLTNTTGLMDGDGKLLTGLKTADVDALIAAPHVGVGGGQLADEIQVAGSVHLEPIQEGA